MRKCPRCGCGVAVETIVCEYCGGVISNIAILGDEISGIVCGACGEQNRPDAEDCRFCGLTLTRNCPRCGEPVGIDAAMCEGCGLDAAAFFDECVRIDIARAEALSRRRRRAARIDDIVAIGCVTAFALAGWRQRFRSDAPEWQIALYVTVLYLVMWALAKSGPGR